MTYVITQGCCNDASCVAVCPVDCIHPAPGDPDFMTAEMLYIDPDSCIDCAACVEACPVDAVRLDSELEEDQQRFEQINADYFVRHPSSGGIGALARRRPTGVEGVRVAVVGTGPAGCYAAAELALIKGVEVDVYDKLLTPYGLVRYGVAPDHQRTKAISEVWKRTLARPSTRVHLGVQVGTDLTHDDLARTHSAVVYAVGADADRRLEVPGEELTGSHAATDFVAWYNGHPDHVDVAPDLSTERVVVVGNGNVALDLARILLTPPDDLERTDIADHALEALRASQVREVVLLGRRGPAQAAYTSSELLALARLPGVDVIIDPADIADEVTAGQLADGTATAAVRLKTELAAELAERAPTGAPRRVVLRFLAAPVELVGDDTVEGIRIARTRLVPSDDGTSVRAEATDEVETLETGLVLRSVGYRGRAVPGVPFDDVRGVIPNAAGRVLDATGGAALPAVYTVGWIKRGPSGSIGSNRVCATETVSSLLEDVAAGVVVPAPERSALDDLLAERAPEAADLAAWHRLDRAERQAGAERGRPRVKFVDAVAAAEAMRAVE
jgi:ferredoxin--NADP+ reductase